MMPTIPFHQDGTRLFHKDDERIIHFNLIKLLLDQYQLPYTIINESDYYSRIEKIKLVINFIFLLS